MKNKYITPLLSITDTVAKDRLMNTDIELEGGKLDLGSINEEYAD